MSWYGYDASGDVKHDVINDVIHADGFVFTVFRVVPLKICVSEVKICVGLRLVVYCQILLSFILLLSVL